VPPTAPAIRTTPAAPAVATAPPAPAALADTNRNTGWNQALRTAVDAATQLRAATATSVAPAASVPSATSPTLASLAAGAADSSPAARALKQALAKGIDNAVAGLGRENGFLTNVGVRIPMPTQLQTVEKTLRRLHQDRLADDFVTTMNRAAEKAVPAGVAVFGDALKQMTIQDAQAILTGPQDAATQYFRKTAGPGLMERFLPIVKQATAASGVTSAYKQLVDKAGIAATLLGPQNLDLDRYVTQKAADGLFQMVAEEEKRIRQNPVARTTDLLKQVFGALGR
jgi:hypothetical protein